MKNNVVFCPPCGENVGLPTKRGAYKGFTLIELLVVVLIIGILAAVAVPQYKKAVIKARVVQTLTVFNAYSKAIDLWLLSNPWPTTRQVRFTGDGSATSSDYVSLDIEVGDAINAVGNSVQGNLQVEAKILANSSALIRVFPYDNEACYPQFQRQPSAQAWNLAGIKYGGNIATAAQCNEYKQIMCQYWAKEGTGLGRSTSIEQCARFGITLTESGT